MKIIFLMLGLIFINSCLTQSSNAKKNSINYVKLNPLVLDANITRSQIPRQEIIVTSNGEIHADKQIVDYFNSSKNGESKFQNKPKFPVWKIDKNCPLIKIALMTQLYTDNELQEFWSPTGSVTISAPSFGRRRLPFLEMLETTIKENGNIFIVEKFVKQYDRRKGEVKTTKAVNKKFKNMRKALEEAFSVKGTGTDLPTQNLVIMFAKNAKWRDCANIFYYLSFIAKKLHLFYIRGVWLGFDKNNTIILSFNDFQTIN